MCSYSASLRPSLRYMKGAITIPVFLGLSIALRLSGTLYHGDGWRRDNSPSRRTNTTLLLKVTTSLPAGSANVPAVSICMLLAYVLPSLPATATVDQSVGVEELSAVIRCTTVWPKTRQSKLIFERFHVSANRAGRAARSRRNERSDVGQTEPSVADLLQLSSLRGQAAFGEPRPPNQQRREASTSAL